MFQLKEWKEMNALIVYILLYLSDSLYKGDKFLESGFINMFYFYVWELLGSIYLRFDKSSVENITRCQLKIANIITVSVTCFLCPHFLFSLSCIPPHLNSLPLLFSFIQYHWIIAPINKKFANRHMKLFILYHCAKPLHMFSCNRLFIMRKA